MTLTMTLQYIDTLSGGRKRFRRRFPKAVQAIIGQEFFQVPMKAREGVALVNEREALVSQFNKIVKDAQRQAKGIDPVTPRERWVSVVEKAQTMVEEVVVSPSGDDDGDDVTCHGIFPPFGIRVRPKEGTDNEANEIQRRTDHRHPDRA